MSYIVYMCPGRFIWLVESSQILEIGFEAGHLKARINRLSHVSECTIDGVWMREALNEYARLTTAPVCVPPGVPLGLQHLKLCRPAIERLGKLVAVGETDQSGPAAAQPAPPGPLLPAGFLPKAPQPPPSPLP